MKFKSLLKNIGVSVVKNGCGYSGLKVKLMEQTFLHADTNSWKLKVALIINGWAWSNIRVL